MREKYRIPVTVPPIDSGGAGAGAPGKEGLGKPPAMSERVIGKVYQTPKGPYEWTENGWRPATNG